MNWRALLRGFGKALLGTLRYALTLALFCGLWWYDARYLNQAFDANLSLLKAGSGLVDGSGKTEAMLRAFSAEKMLLFGEGSGLLWLLGKCAAVVGSRIFRRSKTETLPPDAPRAAAKQR